jgi:septal ring factor EnvC (AmiA/AmiB activator)
VTGQRDADLDGLSAEIERLHNELAAERQVSDQRAGNIAMLEAEVERLRARLAGAAAELDESDAAVAAALGITERTYLDCACLGSCEGRDTLAPDRHCQLDRRER